jgi:predicted transcriptional regulator
VANQSPEAIARWAEKQAKPAHTPKYRRLNDADRVYMLKLAEQGLTQVQIAERLNCDQSAVSRWLAACQDSTKEAISYLQGQSLYMARKIRNEGKPSDLVAVLKGTKVLEEQQVREISVTINGVMLAGMSMTQLSPRSDVVEGETLQIPQQTGPESDK